MTLALARFALFGRVGGALALLGCFARSALFFVFRGFFVSSPVPLFARGLLASLALLSFFASSLRFVFALSSRYLSPFLCFFCFGRLACSLSVCSAGFLFVVSFFRVVPSFCFVPPLGMIRWGGFSRLVLSPSSPVFVSLFFSVICFCSLHGFHLAFGVLLPCVVLLLLGLRFCVLRERSSCFSALCGFLLGSGRVLIEWVILCVGISLDGSPFATRHVPLVVVSIALGFSFSPSCSARVCRPSAFRLVGELPRSLPLSLAGFAVAVYPFALLCVSLFALLGSASVAGPFTF